MGTDARDRFKVEHAHHKTVDDIQDRKLRGRDFRDTQLGTVRLRPKKEKEQSVLFLGWLGLNMQLHTTETIVG